VRLSGWTFTNVTTTSQLTLPNVDMYLGTTTLGNVPLAEQARPRVSFATTERFGSGASPRLLALSPGSGYLWGLDTYSSAVGGLTTIVSAAKNPGEESVLVDATSGRVFFGEDDLAGNYYTWHSSTGLSTLLVGKPVPGKRSAALTSSGRLYVGCYEWGTSCAFNTWTVSGGMQTIINSDQTPGRESLGIYQERAYFCGRTTSSGRFFTWEPATGLSTITWGDKPGWKSAIVSAATGRVSLGAHGHSPFWTWKPGESLITIDIDAVKPGNDFARGINAKTDDVYATADDQVLFWQATGALSTVIHAAGGLELDAFVSHPTSGLSFFGTTDDRFMRHDPATGLITTLRSGMPDVGRYGAIGIDTANNRVYWGDTTSFYTWDQANGVFSQILSGSVIPGQYSTYVDANTGRVFFSENKNPGNFYAWHPSTGLQTLVSGRNTPGLAAMAFDTLNGRMFFGENNEGGNIYVWDPTNGLSTVLTGYHKPGVGRAIAYHAGTGILYFGESQSATGNFYAYKTTPSTVNMRRALPNGLPNQGVTIDYHSGAYQALAQDIAGDLYFVDGVSRTVDRYRYQSGTQKYSRIGQSNWSGGATTVGAIAIDQSSSGMALLDVGNKQIDVYASRTATGAVTPSSSISLASLTSPTGLSMNGRNGDYLVLDAAVQSSTYVRLMVYSSGGTWKQTIPIDVRASNLGTNETGALEFKIQYDDQANVLYLVSVTSGRVYSIALPQYLN
ncbi:MAG: hypothetical protein SFZ03_03785, partial [Candidatus Melainabacteria bacterium]|nr:hypothetical protein [Candidatus Melainabacteria bacterium]